jgi:hypothetical protein
MKLGILSLLVLAQALQSSAYPWMAGPGAERGEWQLVVSRCGIQFKTDSRAINLQTAAYDEMLHRRAEKLEERALLGGVLGGLVTGVGSTAGGVISGVTGALGNLVNGLATEGASNVDASNRFPDVNHPFQAPGPTE